MARATKAAAVKPAPEPEETEDEFPLAYLLDKDPSQVHLNFCDYIEKMTGEDIADPKTVQLVISQYQKFQKTPEHQEFNAKRREAAAAKAQEREERATERTAKAPAEKAPRTRAKAVEAEEEAPAARPARTARRGAVTPPPAKRTTGRRRPAPAAASAEDLD
jgi:hypothetical protein